MKTATKSKLQALPRLGQDVATDGAVLAQLAALQRLSVNELKAKWEQLFDKPAPNNARAFLELQIGYRIQELTYGGLSRETRRALDLLADEVEGKISRKGMSVDARNPLPGTRLLREWDGVEHAVTVMAAGARMRHGSAIARPHAPDRPRVADSRIFRGGAFGIHSSFRQLA